MTISRVYRTAIAASALLMAGAVNATVLALPGSNAMSTGTYNSFEVYSLELLEKCAAAGDSRCLPAGPFPVDSSPGQIADQAVILTSANGMSNFTSPFAAGSAVDDVFLTPTGNQGATYSMTGADAGGTFTGDIANRWDINVALLKTYLNNHDLVFLFDNNQEGNANGQDLLIWGQARIVNANGDIVDNLCFEISSGSGGCGSNTGLDPSPPLDAYLPAVGDFCVDKNTGVAYLYGSVGTDGDCNPVLKQNSSQAIKDQIAAHPNGGYYVSNNISTSTAEFAVFNQRLNDAILNPLYKDYSLSINIKYAGNDAGAEQLWICSECDRPKSDVPEPASLALLSAALFGLASIRRRKMQA